METRKIVIVDSSTNQKVVVNTDATTFGELKRAARAAGINYEGKDWLEGITKSSPMADDSVLPTNVNFKGTVTNDLVYMLTNTNKKIKSGSRKELYASVKAHNLAETIKKKYGKNYTQVSNEDLEKVIAKYESKNAPKSSPKCCNNNNNNEYHSIVYALAKFITLLPENLMQDAYSLAKTLDPDPIVKNVEFTDADLQALFK